MGTECWSTFVYLENRYPTRFPHKKYLRVECYRTLWKFIVSYCSDCANRVNPVRERPFDFYGGEGGGCLHAWNFFLPRRDPVFLFASFTKHTLVFTPILDFFFPAKSGPGFFFIEKSSRTPPPPPPHTHTQTPIKIKWPLPNHRLSVSRTWKWPYLSRI